MKEPKLASSFIDGYSGQSAYSFGGRYFEAIRLPELDHFKTVEPDATNHVGYLLLRDFFCDQFKPLIQKKTLTLAINGRPAFDTSALSIDKLSTTIDLTDWHPVSREQMRDKIKASHQKSRPSTLFAKLTLRQIHSKPLHIRWALNQILCRPTIIGPRCRGSQKTAEMSERVRISSHDLIL
jgi:hypothetical protein